MGESKEQYLPAETSQSAFSEDEAKETRKQIYFEAGVSEKEHLKKDENAGKKAKRHERRRSSEVKQQSVSADGAEKVRSKTKSKGQHLPAEAPKSAALEDEAKKM